MMQWHVGPIPEDDFRPDASWRGLDEPPPDQLIKLAAKYGTIAGIVLISGWIFLTPLFAGGLAMPRLTDVLLFFPAFAALILVHELLHAVLHPGYGWTSKTVIGWWPERGIFYAHYQGELPRDRLVMLALLPFLVISVAPLVLAILMQSTSPWAAVISILNGILACGDLFVVALLLRQVPAGAILRNQGYLTYWRPHGPARAQN